MLWRKPKIIWHVPEDRKNLLPKRATSGSMAYDLICPTGEIVKPQDTLLINTLVAVTIPKGYAMILGTRSSMAQNSVTVEAGWIDSDYRGLLKVLLYNHGDVPYEIIPGERVAQALIIKTHNLVTQVSFKYPNVRSTKRGSGGFGSTGR